MTYDLSEYGFLGKALKKELFGKCGEKSGLCLRKQLLLSFQENCLLPFLYIGWGWGQERDCQGWISSFPLKLLPTENVISDRVKISEVSFPLQVQTLIYFPLSFMASLDLSGIKINDLT